MRFVGMTLMLAVGLCSFGLASADSSRAPTKKERKWIRKAAMKDCRQRQGTVVGYGCEWRGGIRISTANPRYAWAEVYGPQHDHSGILRRKSPRAKYWRVKQVVGGGIQPCSYWYAKAPRRVVRDLRIEGFRENSGSFDYHRC